MKTKKNWEKFNETLPKLQRTSLIQIKVQTRKNSV